MKISIKILVLFLFCGILNLSGQGEFYTINHDTQVILKSSKKNSALNKYYVNDGLEDILIFRNGIDRPILLKGNIDFMSNNVDFDLLGQKHMIPLENVDSVLMGVIPNDLKNMVVEKYVNGNRLDNDSDYFLHLLVDGKVKLYKRTKVKIRRANYNKALDIGNKKESYQVKFEYFIFTENGELLEVPKKSKSFLKIIAPYKGAASFYKREKLSNKKEEDLESLITYINKQ